MQSIDSTQNRLDSYLKKTESIMNELLCRKPFYGNVRIICNLDLGFPHDVIRIAGGFATGIYVSWYSRIPFIPVDICMNVCSVSIYKLDFIHGNFFTEDRITKLLENLKNSSYIANFHRGNHFISYLESMVDSSRYIMIHSSAAEFETLYNGLYPVENNYFFHKTKTYYSGSRYIRYLEGSDAELYWKIADNLYTYNENRHDFIINCLIGEDAKIVKENHYHHYGMPSECEAIIGCHMLKKGEEAPLLTRPGENVYLLRYNNRLDGSIDEERFTAPHGLGKRHVGMPSISVSRNLFRLDKSEYKIKYGESLRSHPCLYLRDLPIEDFMKHLKNEYDYQVIDEYKQLISLNKSGIIVWRDYEE